MKFSFEKILHFSLLWQKSAKEAIVQYDSVIPTLALIVIPTIGGIFCRQIKMFQCKDTSLLPS